MKLRFSLWPGHWGLKGKTREKAKAEYELTGKDLDYRLAEINIEDEQELALEHLSIDRKHKTISKEEYDYKYVELKFTKGHKGTLAKLELDKKYGKITNMEYEKAIYSLDDKPWVGVIGSEYNPDQGTAGFSFELDWNDAFVKMCVKSGYNGTTDEQVVEQWFEDVATEEYYKYMLDPNSELEDGNPGNFGTATPDRTTHERIDDTKTKHS